jgi:GSH-dependent disulfide-bond oxidoreductase
MTGTIELHGERTGNCLRISVALEEAGLPYSVVHVDLRSGAHRRPDHLKLNPWGKVPSIVDSTVAGEPFVLSQSNAIIFYLDQKAPGHIFPSDDVRARAIALERFFYFLTEVISTGMSSFQLGSGQPGQLILRDAALSSLIASNRFLTDSRFMAGDAFSAADIAAFTFAMAYQRAIDWASAPELRRWFDEVGNRPTVQRGLAAFDR